MRLSALGLGGAPLGNLYRAMSDEDARATLDAALAAGFRHVDTAPYYGFGLSERRVGDGLRGRDDVVLSTKVGRLLSPAIDLPPDRDAYHGGLPFRARFDYSYDGVMRSVEDSLQRLGRARVDILYLHDIGRRTHGDAHPALFAQAMDGGYRALDELRAQGVVGAIGLGVNEIEVCLEAMRHGRFDAFLVAGRYTLLEQDALDAFLPACLEHGASVVAGGVYNSGVLAVGSASPRARFDYGAVAPPVMERVRRLEAVCARFDVPLAAAALRFPLAHPAVAAVIPGLAGPGEVDATMTLWNAPIPADFWVALKDERLLRSDAPVPAADAAVPA